MAETTRTISVAQELKANRFIFLNKKTIINKLKRYGPKDSLYVTIQPPDGIEIHMVYEGVRKCMCNTCKVPVMIHGHPVPMHIDRHQWAYVLNDNISVELTPVSVSTAVNDKKVTISYYGGTMKELKAIDLNFTVLYVSIDSDADRDGIIEENNPDKGTWKGGPNGHGAVLVTRNDDSYMGPKFEAPVINNSSEIIDNADSVYSKYTHLKIRTKGPRSMKNMKLRLYVKEELSQWVMIFNMTYPIPGVKENFRIIGFRQETATLEVPIQGEVDLLVMGTVFPDESFDGIINVYIEYRLGMLPMYTDHVALRIAPWIMTPNTQTPTRFFSSQMGDSKNQFYLDQLKKFAAEANVKFTIVPSKICQSNQWMQDEIEFGYSAAPTVTSTTVLHSPRDRGFTAFVKTMLAKEMGVIERYNPQQDRQSLDCFGNLECSPPVTVDGVDYPFGRIYYGSTLASCQGLADSTEMGPFRRMMKVVRRFLHGQKVQKPFELYSDWLIVGHVDEFCSFVPAKCEKKFKLLLASPNLFYNLMDTLKEDGHGNTKMLEGKKWLDGSSATISVNEFISNIPLRKFNATVQQMLDYNRDIMKRELGLDESDIIDLPLPFHGDQKDWASGHGVAYFPNMVNLAVLGSYLGIPKPFGPLILGRCYFEQYVMDRLEPLGLVCRFIDNWDHYHIEDGEVHCGSNTLRKPFDTPWWTTDF